MTPPLPLFDTHAHLDQLATPPDVATQLTEARAAGVAEWLVPGIGPDAWQRLLALAHSAAGVYAAPGVHPAAADSWNGEVGARLAHLLAGPHAVAVGEIGLDASTGMPPPELQETALRAQLRLALECGKPVLLHCRHATGRLLEFLQEEGTASVGGIWHAFSGSLETARAAQRLGLVLGFGGTVTYPNARRVLEVLREVPAEMIVLETDSPDLSPFPFRDQPNRPARLRLIAERVAAVRGWSLERTAAITTENARRVLKLSHPDITG